MRKVFLFWGLSAILVAMICGLIYLIAQQSVRQAANDPQIEISEDLAQTLATGVSPDNIGSPSFDLGQSLAPFVAVYDASGKPLAYTATLDGNAPMLPSGVFDSAKKIGEDRFTWQPKSGVRQAVVLSYFNGKAQGFVAAGRSLREVEVRETELELLAAIGLVALWIVSFAVIWFGLNFSLRHTDLAANAMYRGEDSKAPGSDPGALKK